MLQSPPSWRRGLKYVETNEPDSRSEGSPPSWRRGLKFLRKERVSSVGVASFPEAWIEINCTACHILKQAESPPSRRRGLKLRLRYI